MAVGRRGARARPRPRSRVPRRAAPVPGLPSATRGLPRRRAPDPRRLRHAGPVARGSVPADDAPAPERRARGVGTGAPRRRPLPPARRAAHAPGGRARADEPFRRAADLARRLLRMAPAVAVRHRAPAPGLAPARRARELPPRRLPRLVAGAPGRAAGAEPGREGRLPLRRLRAREPARTAARAPPAPPLRRLQACAGAPLGALGRDRSAARGDHDGLRAGGRLVRRLRLLLPALPP